MLYHGENPILKITAVDHLQWEDGVFSVPAREHASLTFRIRGSATVTCGDESHFVNSGDILYLPQNLAYTAAYTDTELIAIHFVTAQNDPRPEIYCLDNAEQIYKRFLRACALWERKDPACAVEVLSELYGILGEICQKETTGNLPPHFVKAISYINANFTKDIRTSDICANAGISGTAFRQLFRQYYQKSPVEYITLLRLEYARNLIAEGMSVEQAALSSGFHDAKYFARTVKKHLNCTPRELKNYGK